MTRRTYQRPFKTIGIDEWDAFVEWRGILNKQLRNNKGTAGGGSAEKWTLYPPNKTCELWKDATIEAYRWGRDISKILCVLWPQYPHPWNGCRPKNRLGRRKWNSLRLFHHICCGGVRYNLRASDGKWSSQGTVRARCCNNC